MIEGNKVVTVSYAPPAEFRVLPERRRSVQTRLTRLLQSASLFRTSQQTAEPHMAATSREPTVRVTATITKEQDRTLRGLAAGHDVSVAWLVRYAISRLVEQADSVQFPLDLRRPR